MTTGKSGNESLIKYLEYVRDKEKPYIISALGSKKQQLLDKQIADYSKSCCVGIIVED